MMRLVRVGLAQELIVELLDLRIVMGLTDHLAPNFLPDAARLLERRELRLARGAGA